MENWLAFDIGEAFKLKESQGIRGALGYGSIGEFISAVLPNIYVVAGVILFFLMIGGGIMFIKSAGSGDEEKVKKSKSAITAALVGFLIIFLSYWIIQLIEILTGIKIFGGEL